MNSVFIVCVTLSLFLMLFTAPAEILPALSRGTEGAVSLCLTLTASFALWGGFTEIARRTGAQKSLSRLLNRPLRALFGESTPAAREEIATNLSANFLGLGAIATPAGVAAVAHLKAGAENQSTFERQTGILLILNSCCMQLLPTGVISLRLSLGSSAPADIWIPTLLTGLFSTLCALTCAAVWQKIARKNKGTSARKKTYPAPLAKTAGASKGGAHG